MRLDKINAESFGPFRGESLELAPGMTVIHGPNESGKSSWFAALYAGLCGRRRQRGRGTAFQAEFKRRYEPWVGRGWKVGVDLTLDDGRRIRLLHDLKRGTTAITDLVTDQALDVADLERRLGRPLVTDSTVDGSRILGLNRTSARATLFVWQADVTGVASDPGILQEYLQRAATNDAVDVTAEQALGVLGELRSDRVGSATMGRRPLRAATEELSSARRDADAARDAYQRLQTMQRDRAGVAASLVDVDRQVEDLDRRSIWVDIQKMERTLERATALSAQLTGLAGDPPAAPEQVEEVRRVLGAFTSRGAVPVVPDGATAAAIEAELAALPTLETGDVEPHTSVNAAAKGLAAAQTALATHAEAVPPEHIDATSPLTPTELRAAAMRLAEAPPPAPEPVPDGVTSDSVRAEAAALDVPLPAVTHVGVDADPDELLRLAVELDQPIADPGPPVDVAVSSDTLHAHAARLDVPAPPRPTPVNSAYTADELRTMAAALARPLPEPDPAISERVRVLEDGHAAALAEFTRLSEDHASAVADFEVAQAAASEAAAAYERDRAAFDTEHSAYLAALAEWNAAAPAAPAPITAPAPTTNRSVPLVAAGVFLVIVGIAVAALVAVPAGAVALVVGLAVAAVGLLRPGAGETSAPTPVVTTPQRGAQPVAPVAPSPPAVTWPTPPGPSPTEPSVPGELDVLRAKLVAATESETTARLERDALTERLEEAGLPLDPDQLLTQADAVEATARAEQRYAEHTAEVAAFTAQLREEGLPADPQALRDLAHDLQQRDEEDRAREKQLAARELLLDTLSGRTLPTTSSELRALAGRLNDHHREVQARDAKVRELDERRQRLRDANLPTDLDGLRSLASRIDAAAEHRRRRDEFDRKLDETRQALIDAGAPTDPDALNELARRIEETAGSAERHAAHATRQSELAAAVEGKAVTLREAIIARVPEDAQRDDQLDDDALHQWYLDGCLRRAEQAKQAARRQDLTQALAARQTIERQVTDRLHHFGQLEDDLISVVNRLRLDGNPDDPAGAAERWLTEQSVRSEQASERHSVRAALDELLGESSIDDLEREHSEAMANAGPRPSEPLDDLETARDEAARRQRALRERVADLGGKIESLADTMPSVAQAIEREAAAERALEAVHALADVIQLATEHLQEAKDRAHATIAPALEATLRPWVPGITGGRYTDVDIDPESLVIRLHEHAGQFREATLLSHGTAEQAYLLLRLALAEHLGNGIETVPMILDDVTVQSDSTRTLALLDLLHDLSRDRQIVVFSQEQEVIDWAKARLVNGDRDAVVALGR